MSGIVKQIFICIVCLVLSTLGSLYYVKQRMIVVNKLRKTNHDLFVKIEQLKKNRTNQIRKQHALSKQMGHFLNGVDTFPLSICQARFINIIAKFAKKLQIQVSLIKPDIVERDNGIRYQLFRVVLNGDYFSLYHFIHLMFKQNPYFGVAYYNLQKSNPLVLSLKVKVYGC